MMCEIQGPGGRYRLGEVVHKDSKTASEATGDAAEGDEVIRQTRSNNETDSKARPSIDEMAFADMPRLAAGGAVELDVQNEMKELGLQVLIVSVAWETEAGRRTFQRFFKFHVRIFPSPCACSAPGGG